MSGSTITSQPQYTAAEIYERASELPGFRDTGNIYDICTDITQASLWQTVLSATVVTRFDDGLKVLTSSRTAEGNTTHVNFASTPTKRIPPPEAGALIIDEDVPFCLSGNILPWHPFISRSLTPSVAWLPDSSDVLAEKVEHLLSRKLQLSAALERARQPIGRASVARCIAGFSYQGDNPSGEALFAPLIMLGAIVGLHPEAAKQIPSETPSYNYLGWTPINQYVHGIASRTLLEVIPTAKEKDKLEICIQGLCNITSSAILANPDEIQYHLTEDGILPEF